MLMIVFKKLLSSLPNARAKGYHFATLRMIFGVKLYLKRKSRLFNWIHVVDSYGHEVYASTMKSVSARVLMEIEAVNNLDVMMGDIVNVYRNANTEENIYSRAGAKFDMVFIMA